MVFLFILLAILVIIILLMFSKINIQIINLKFNSQSEKNKENRHINKNYKVIIKLYILGKIPILKLNITRTKLEKIYLKDTVKNRLKKINKDLILDKNKFDKDFLKSIKKLNLAIKNINLKIELGTQNAALTAILVPAISTIIAIYLRKKVKSFKNQTFIINPVFENQNLINIVLSGIFEIKMIHIINIIYIMNKKGRVNKNERTSNRRAYGYSYE